MLHIISWVIIAIAVCLFLATTVLLFSEPFRNTNQILAPLLALFGILLAAIGFLGGITRQSKITVSATISRKEFYGVILAVLGLLYFWLSDMSGRINSLSARIDQIYQLFLK
jgi:hypothetical protein